MILGESHYSDDYDPMLTNNVVRRYLDSNEDHEDWMKTFLKFERSLVGKETTSIDRANIWESLVFYNYLQVLKLGGNSSILTHLLLSFKLWNNFNQT